ncbi:hypothetical protein [Bartonella tamiae]|uniref:Uncharacterized protein n=1 Tax=Bartonella tamiae Th239 TaxID=1094558 RepID=J0ZSF2_9HYPH|nr:hypothetical protein [Bartonella tamiae]EJF91693.1 hypothetical protein ME5_00072 [Bartonella tamiae Th239]
MAAGVRIFNDANTIQIDDSYQNLVMIKSGELITDWRGMAELHIEHDGPLILATSCSNGSSCSVQDRTGLTWHYLIGSAPANAYVKWYAFSNPLNPQFNFGLRVFDANGRITFDSNQKPLVISYFFSIDTPLLDQISLNDIDGLPKEDEVARPQNIYVPLRQGRTYTAFPIKYVGAVSVVYQSRTASGGKKISYDHYCYMPFTSVGGITFVPIKEVTNSPSRIPEMRPFYRPRGSPWRDRVQQYWVIDVTGY